MARENKTSKRVVEAKLCAILELERLYSRVFNSGPPNTVWSEEAVLDDCHLRIAASTYSGGPNSIFYIYIPRGEEEIAKFLLTNMLGTPIKHIVVFDEYTYDALKRYADPKADQRIELYEFTSEMRQRQCGEHTQSTDERLVLQFPQE